MGHCCSKGATVSSDSAAAAASADANSTHQRPKPPPSPVAVPPSPHPNSNSFTMSPFQSPLPAGVAPSPARTPRKFRWPLPPPSPAKPIMSAIMKRLGPGKENKADETTPAEENANGVGEDAGRGRERELDKNFGYAKNFGAKFEIGKEVGRGHFGHTCWAKGKKGDLKGLPVAVKVISKSKVRIFTSSRKHNSIY